MEEIGLYLHYPFCVRKCAYCDFLSAPADEATRSRYVEALLRDLSARAEVLAGLTVRSVYIGGGTPSLMEPAEVTSVMRRLRELAGGWLPDAECTLEANPGTVTRAKADAWIQAGINRISMGMQASQDDLLRLLGRIHRRADIGGSVSILRQAGFRNLNLDLMMGLPGQSAEDWKETLDMAFGLEPEHLSCYSLILEEGTPLEAMVRSGRLSLPDEELDRAMYEETLRRTRSHGYEQYEISNFAKPGFASRHNLGYWDLSPNWGIGLGASSYIGGRRLKNTTDLSAYLEAGDPSQLVSVEQEASRDNDLEEYMFLGLRRTEGISVRAFRKRFHIDLEEEYGSEIRRLTGEGLLERRGDRVFLTRRGLDLANYVFEAFLR